MKVILIQDVSGLGHKGDVVDVADGHARNYLVPRSLALEASAGALKNAESLQRARQEALRKAREEAEQLAEALVGSHVVVAARSADEGKLFGSIGPRDVAEAIHKFTGIEVDRDHIELPAPIKEIGLHELTIRPHPDVAFQLTLDVVPA